MPLRRAAARPVGSWAPALVILALLAVPAFGLGVAGSAAPTPLQPSVGHRAGTVANPVALIPHRPPVHRGAVPHGLGVDPTALYSSEPAPMGIADFGVDSAGNGYVYNTSAFLAHIELHSLTVQNFSDFDAFSLTFQLNVVLTFLQTGSWYYYWIQDVAFLNTSTNTVSFENNIWNFSGSTSMDSNSVSGNGSVFGNTFYATGAGTQPGNGISLTYPANIDLRTVAKVSGGRPMVDFDYRDGHNWQTYDNAVFPFAKGASNINFTVNGTNYNPLGLFNDAELTLGGPGNGAATTATKANLTVSLSYFNGENFQSVQNAYNFGSDTAEAITPLTPHLQINAVNGTLSDHLTLGSGTPDVLFERSQDAVVNIQTLVTGGTVVVNGTTGTLFGGNPINLTLAAGNYDLAIYLSGVEKDHTNVTLTGGEFLQLFLAAGTVSTVRFNETGLPVGHRWFVTLGPFQKGSAISVLSFPVINATYAWRVAEISGWIPNATHGTVTISGSGANISLNFSIVLYPITLFQSGLPENTLWGVRVANATHTTLGASLNFDLPNGSFVYRYTLVPGWFPARGTSGNLAVNGLSLSRTVSFRVFTFNVSLAESGLGPGIVWGIEVGTLWDNGSVPLLSVPQPNGTFPYRIHSPGGWSTAPSSGSVQVLNQTVTLNVTFVPFLVPVLFVETGLPASTAWTVNVSGLRESSTTSNVSFSLGNGSYKYSVLPVVGFVANASANGSFGVTGRPLRFSVGFSVLPSQFGILQLTVHPSSATISIDGLTRSSAGGFLEVSLPVGRHELTVRAPGFHPSDQNLTVVNGARTILLITLSPLPQTPLTTHPNPGAVGPTGILADLGGTLGFGLIAGAIVAAGVIGWAATRRRAPPSN